MTWKLVNLPFRIFFGLLGILVWHVFSSGSWKYRRKMGGCPVPYLQEQVRWSAYQNRQQEEEYARREAEFRATYNREIEKRERVISRLRSQKDTKR